MNTRAPVANATKDATASVTLSRWVNERPLPITEILSAHDVARLTQRPIWLLAGMALIGRFPQKRKHRGRRVGWCRSDVLDWLSRDLSVVADRPPAARCCARRQSRQACLPLECSSACSPLHSRHSQRGDKGRKSHCAGPVRGTTM